MKSGQGSGGTPRGVRMIRKPFSRMRGKYRG